MDKEKIIIRHLNELIGIKVNNLRLAKKVRSIHLAKKIGVSVHQLQKYEKGVNMISAGRLVLIAQGLGEKVNYFHKGLELEPEPIVTEYQRIFRDVLKNFFRIQDSETQKAISQLIKSLAK